jgi:hypothetical protein
MSRCQGSGVRAPTLHRWFPNAEVNDSADARQNQSAQFLQKQTNKIKEQLSYITLNQEPTSLVQHLMSMLKRRYSALVNC